MKRTNNYLNRNFKKERGDDLLSKKKRSELMSKIRSRGTKFEKEFITTLRKISHKKFQINVTSIKGKPDIVFLKEKVCIFLDSDFWHGWYYPRWKHLLKNDFWREKIEKNRKRDKKTTVYLRKYGWKVFRIWEHEINNNFDKIIERINKFLNNVKISRKRG
ncbi:MAG: very short patch repair endonuclease [Candidatus Azambacteria bacterium]|nr:very short patch repair endonuclease [Candidatus Azambacteria bacterium]